MFVCIILTCGKVNKFKWSIKGCLARKIVIAKIYVHDMEITACLHWERVTHAGTFKLLDAYRITREKLMCRLLISSCIKIFLYEAGQNRYGYPSNSATRKTRFMREGNYSSSFTFPVIRVFFHSCKHHIPTTQRHLPSYLQFFERVFWAVRTFNRNRPCDILTNLIKLIFEILKILH